MGEAVGFAITCGLFAGAVFGQLVGVSIVTLNKWGSSPGRYLYFGFFFAVIYAFIGLLYGLILGCAGLALQAWGGFSITQVSAVYVFFCSFFVLYFIARWLTVRPLFFKITIPAAAAGAIVFISRNSLPPQDSTVFLPVFLCIALSLPAFVPFCFVWFLRRARRRAGPVHKKIPSTAGRHIDCYDTSSKILFVGVDAASWEMIDMLRRKNKIPVLSRIIRDGFCADFIPTKPTSSAMIWTSIATGKPPSEHGIMHWQKTVFPGIAPLPGEALNIRRPKGCGAQSIIKFLIQRNIVRIRPYTSSSRKCGAIWNMLTACGKKSANIGWLFSWPAEKVEGLSVSWYVYPFEEVSNKLQQFPSNALKQRTYPEGLMETLDEFIVTQKDITPDTLRALGIPASIGRHSERKFADKISPWYLAKDTTFLNITRHITALHPTYSFIATYLSGIDVTSHAYWPFLSNDKRFEKLRRQILSISHDEEFKEASRSFHECIERYYEYLDHQIGLLLDAVDETWTVMVCSDHGFRHDGTEHRDAPPGIFIAYGKHIKPAAGRGEVTPYDIAPTVLALTGAPVGRDMKGRVLREAVEDNFFTRYPVRYIDTYEDIQRQDMRDSADTPQEVEDALKRRLRALGYIE